MIMQQRNRVWEIDFIRGIAIILMTIFHLIVDLKDFYAYKIEYLSGFWYYEGKLSAILFMLVSGISCTFSKSNIKRGLKVFSFGMLLTLTTYFYDPETYIRFGILHFLGASMILYNFIKNLNNKMLIAISILFILVGNIFSDMLVDSPYLFPIGLINKNFASLDYYPLFPWFGIFAAGILIGKTVYKNRKSIFPFNFKHDFISLLGKHSLPIYLIHQPALLAILFVIHKYILK
jgi:uncharacterized membrane protein